jgi:hypothetical protein
VESGDDRPASVRQFLAVSQEGEDKVLVKLEEEGREGVDDKEVAVFALFDVVQQMVEDPLRPLSITAGWPGKEETDQQVVVGGGHAEGVHLLQELPGARLRQEDVDFEPLFEGAEAELLNDDALAGVRVAFNEGDALRGRAAAEPCRCP